MKDVLLFSPMVDRNTFTIPNPFPHDPKKNPTIEVVYASFAACLERAYRCAEAKTTPSVKSVDNP